MPSPHAVPRRGVLAVLTAVLLAAGLLGAPAGAAALGEPAGDPLAMPASLSAARAAAESASAAQTQAAGRHRAAQAAETAARQRLTGAQDALTRAVAARDAAAADLVVAAGAQARAQRDVDGMARTMYMTGGQVSPVDLLLADPGERPGAALDTHAYLTGVADATIATADDAASALVAAQARAQAADADARAAQAAVSEASAGLADAQAAAAWAGADVGGAALAAARAQETYRAMLGSWTPATGQPLLDPSVCSDWLVRVLYRAGWRGEDLREAWAIAMRESGGREDAISSTQDYGIFQLNKPTWGSQPWWDDALLLTRDFNAAVAFRLSQGGRTWYPWGLDGQGRPNAEVYVRSGWSEQMIYDRIVVPYARWYDAYPCVDLAAAQAVGVGPSAAFG